MFRSVLTVALTLLATAVSSQSFNRTELGLAAAVRKQPNPLARYQYLSREIPKLSAKDQLFAAQFQSFTLAELGLYNQAVLNFPLESEPIAGLVLPARANYKSVDALEAISRLAVDRRIVMINEAHHNAHTRQLTLALLPRLRALGFDYFAAEALGDGDPHLAQRGYPIKTTGSEYLREPLYGEIVREAIRLGFVIVPYDGVSTDPQTRDAEQAENLYRRVLAKDAAARLFVEAGYAHIDKAKGRLGNVAPMAMQLAKLSSVDALTIDQTEFLEKSANTDDNYHLLIKRFPSRSPEVLIERDNAKPWSAQPTLYDFNVILPPALGVRTFGDELKSGFGDAEQKNVDDSAHLTSGSLIAANDMQRPAWLSLDGSRQRWPINSELCRHQLPCVVAAQYAEEPDDAIAADCYTFLQDYSRSTLYLRPGSYRLRAWNANGVTLSEKTVLVTGR